MEDNAQRLKRLKIKANALPLTPGVYIMKNAAGTIIYIGKAKALKNRVTQYFSSRGHDIVKVQKMVDNVESFDFILTDSEFEALVLECSLIKQYKPKYNILLKDDKGYHYIKVTHDGWRNIYYANTPQKDGSEYLGPYTGSFLVSESVDEAKRIFKLPLCKKSFPRDIGKGRPCLNYFISQCSAPCAGKIKQREYEASVDDALDFLKGGGANQKAIRDMTAEMERLAENEEFERAAVLRDRISAIGKLGEKQKVVSAAYPQQDVFALVSAGGKACLAVLRFSDGRLTDSEHFFTDEISSLPEMRLSMILSYYAVRQDVPPRISLDGEVEDAELLSRYLSEKRAGSVTVCVPQRGEQASLSAMCRENALQKLCDKFGRYSEREFDALIELQSMLGLTELPKRIEAYDISHTGGSDNGGGMVVFEDGKPDKKSYRRFAVKGFTGQDDYASLAEVLDRRLSEYEKAESHDSGFGRLPDLILLDGGKGQVGAVLPVMKAHSLSSLPVFGMVKDGKHRTAAIAAEGGKVMFNEKQKAFAFVTTVQDEVHRYALAYHRARHKKSAFTDILCDIEGVGPAKAKLLLGRYKTMQAIGEATLEELTALKGLGVAAAQNVYKAFHAEK